MSEISCPSRTPDDVFVVGTERATNHSMLLPSEPSFLAVSVRVRIGRALLGVLYCGPDRVRS